MPSRPALRQLAAELTPAQRAQYFAERYFRDGDPVWLRYATGQDVWHGSRTSREGHSAERE